MSNNHEISDTTWKSQAGFIWSLIGSAVGFANILSFSAQVYKNGGGAFLIPYCMALFMLGIPLLILEGIIGYRMKSPLVSAYGSVWGRAGKTLGWMAVLACLSIGGFYIVLTGYSVAYTYFAAVNAIPDDSKGFFIDSFLKTTAGLTDFGQFSVPIIFSTLAVVAITWFVMARNVRDGIERICSIFMPLLVVIMTSFAIIVAFLPGGMDGWQYYLKPDFAKLVDPNLWRDIFGQLFFSLSLGLGIVVGYSRHTGKEINIPKAMMYVAIGDFAVSFISGAAIFGCLAHVSYTQQISFASILTSDSTFEIGFIVFPQIFKVFGPILGQIIGVIFFFCIFIAGITGVFSIVESIAGNVEVEFQTSRKRAVSATIVAMTCVAMFFCMGNASHLIDALVPMVMGTNMLIGGLALILIFQYACPTIKNDSVWISGNRLRPYAFCLKYIAPAILGIILIGNLSQEFQSFDLEKGVRWTWFIFALVSACTLTRVAERKAKATASKVNASEAYQGNKDLNDTLEMF
ncbi:MAG: sodium-dependent transporter [Parachlamydiaceae bacterium]|nr:sodium-dependent transporter [Parachlamydiaceae bacterium]